MPAEHFEWQSPLIENLRHTPEGLYLRGFLRKVFVVSPSLRDQGGFGNLFLTGEHTVSTSLVNGAKRCRLDSLFSSSFVVTFFMKLGMVSMTKKSSSIHDMVVGKLIYADILNVVKRLCCCSKKAD